MIKVFFSFPHDDNKYNFVTNFREHFANEVKIIAPDSVVFYDRLLPAGNDFLDSILFQIRRCDVLVVLLAPAWLKSEWCRKEYEEFITAKRNAGLEPRILPILWTPKEFLDGFIPDSIRDEVLKLQYEDFSDLRHHNWDSPKLRARVAKLAQAAVSLARVDGK